jgi:Na+/H+-dicarboxylate symporter
MPSQTSRILVGMLLGLLLGLAIQLLGTKGDWADTFLVHGVLDIGGRLFLASMKMLVVPLVFISLVAGTSALGNLSTFGRMGGKTLAFYLATTALAVSLALAMGVLFQPGAGADLATTSAFTPGQTTPLSQVFAELLPDNPLAAMAEGRMLQVIAFALLVGVALSASGEAGIRIAAGFADANTVVMRLVGLIMQAAPVGVFCLMAKLLATTSPGALLHLAAYFLVVVGTLLLHGLGTYSLMLRVLGRLSPATFLRKMRDVLMFAFSTASSNATLPVTMETARNRLGVDNRVASFTLPLGATLNMDGTAIMQGVATAFIAQAYNIDLAMGDYLMVILTATLASIGTAGVPGVGIVMLAMVLGQVGLPVEGIALILGVDRLLDMLRTAVNVTGDCCVSCLVAKSEGALDQAAYDRD